MTIWTLVQVHILYSNLMIHCREEPVYFASGMGINAHTQTAYSQDSKVIPSYLPVSFFLDR